MQCKANSVQQIQKEAKTIYRFFSPSRPGISLDSVFKREKENEKERERERERDAAATA